MRKGIAGQRSHAGSAGWGPRDADGGHQVTRSAHSCVHDGEEVVRMDVVFMTGEMK